MVNKTKIMKIKENIIKALEEPKEINFSWWEQERIMSGECSPEDIMREWEEEELFISTREH